MYDPTVSTVEYKTDCDRCLSRAHAAALALTSPSLPLWPGVSSTGTGCIMQRPRRATTRSIRRSRHCLTLQRSCSWGLLCRGAISTCHSIRGSLLDDCLRWDFWSWGFVASRLLCLDIGLFLELALVGKKPCSWGISGQLVGCTPLFVLSYFHADLTMFPRHRGNCIRRICSSTIP